MKDDPRVGLSIDSGSQSCASDLSDSESGWDDDLPPHPSIISDQSNNIMFPAESSWHTSTNGHRTRNKFPRIHSFRSRIPQQAPARQRHETASSWDDDARISRHPRAPSLRFCLTLCALSFVLLSLTNTSNHSSSSIASSQQRQATKTMQLYSEIPKSFAIHGTQLRASKSDPGSQRVTKSALSVPLNGEAKKTNSQSTSLAANKRPRANLAMARSAQKRPVFGEKADWEDEEESTRGLDGEEESPRMTSNNWTSWLAAMALVGMLVETGYKEYRQCRIIEEAQRRL